MDKLLEVKNLSVSYGAGGRILGRKKKKQVLFDVSFDVYNGEILGIVGESGCGKSTLSKAILGINRNIRGEIIHHSERPQMIFQDPAGSLNPAFTVGRIMEEPLRIAGGFSKTERREAVNDMLERVGLGEKYASRYPHELSGGQRQRVAIGLALILRPKLVIADEPVSALDVTIQAQILKLLAELKNDLGLSYIFISHDMDVIYQICDRVIVMKDGRIVESGARDRVFFSPQDEYTKQLLAVSQA